MNYQLTLAIKQRKCSMCSTAIPKATKHFTMNDWPRDADFPTKKNICLDCAAKLTDKEFVGFLRVLLKELSHLETLQQTTRPPSPVSIYVCRYCGGQVKFDQHFEEFQCQSEGCRELYPFEDIQLLKQWKE